MERKLNIAWDTPNGIRADTLDEELLVKMKRAGCTRIWVSPESGNQHVVNHIVKKRMDLGKVEEVVRLCKKLGIQVGCCFVLGFIGETKANMEETIAYARKLKKLGASSFEWSIATPFPGTELWEQAKALGYLKENNLLHFDLYRPVIETPEFSLQEVEGLYRKASRLMVVPSGSPPLILKVLFLHPTLFVRLAWRVVKAWLANRTGKPRD